MNNNISFCSVKAAPRQKAESWWARESYVLGRVVMTAFGVIGIAGAGLLVSMIATLPADVSERYLFALILIGLLFGTPMLVSGAWMLIVSKELPMTPRSVVLVLIVAVLLAMGVDFQADRLGGAGSATQANPHEQVRSLAVRDFVSKMGLKGDENDDMLTKVKSMSDKDLCKASVLPAERCHSVIADN